MIAAPQSDVFRAVSDPTRRAVLLLLRERDHTANELALPFAMTQPAMSQHLRVLRDAGLVRVHSEGRHRVYSLDPSPLSEVFDWISYFEDFWTTRLDNLGKHLDSIP
jgi:DNA-binding transcriptional ArsR family regulator